MFREQCHRSDDTDHFDLSLLLILLAAAQVELQRLDLLCHELTTIIKKQEDRYKHRQKTKKDRPMVDEAGQEIEPRFPSWKTMSDETTDIIFRKKFRMTKAQFTSLCEVIRKKVTDKEFRPEGTKESTSFYLCSEA